MHGAYPCLCREHGAKLTADFLQGYAFVEYSVPNGALKCKEGMDKIEAEMRPDFRRKVSLIRHASWMTASNRIPLARASAFRPVSMLSVASSPAAYMLTSGTA